MKSETFRVQFNCVTFCFGIFSKLVIFFVIVYLSGQSFIKFNWFMSSFRFDIFCLFHLSQIFALILGHPKLKRVHSKSFLYYANLATCNVQREIFIHALDSIELVSNLKSVQNWEKFFGEALHSWVLEYKILTQKGWVLRFTMVRCIAIADHNHFGTNLLNSQVIKAKYHVLEYISILRARYINTIHKKIHLRNETLQSFVICYSCIFIVFIL